ncbi:MAG: DinB family protein [Bryobacteraceae bacterium]
MDLIQALENSCNEFSSAASGLSFEQEKKRPAAGAWSILDCAEHVALVERRILHSLKTASESDVPAADAAKEAQLAAMVSSRERKVTAPEAVQPTGRYSTVAEALADFQAARAKVIAFAEQRGERLYEFAMKHPFFGVLNGAEMITVLIGHTARHRDQVQEIKLQNG